MKIPTPRFTTETLGYSNLNIPIFKFEYPEPEIGRSKYIGPETTLTIDKVFDLGEGCFIVESEKYPDRVYNLNMKSGFCTCGKGVNFAPCKHKSAVASLYNIAEFSVAPIDDPCARALYHYIATGTTLPAHMYRERGSGQTVPEIEKYIEEKLKGKNL